MKSPNETTEPRVIDISLEQVDEAAEVLSKVFIDYPLDHYIFADHGPKILEVLKESFRMDCLWKLGMGWPLCGVQVDGRLAAVLLVVGTSASDGGAIQYKGSPLTASRLEEMEEQLNSTFGEQSNARILEYYAMKNAGKPQQSHLYIEALATLHEYRGKGYGGLLLRHVDRLMQEDPHSFGTGLDTQDPVNVKIYGHCGYHITSEADMGPVHTWFMYKPKTCISKQI